MLISRQFEQPPIETAMDIFEKCSGQIRLVRRWQWYIYTRESYRGEFEPDFIADICKISV